MHDHTHEPVDEAAHFDAAAETWDDDPAKVERARRSAVLLTTELPLSEGHDYLEIGAGTGSLSIEVVDALAPSARITLTDASPGMVRVAAARLAEAGLDDRLMARVLDLTRDELPEASYDGAWSMLAMHHVSALPSLLSAVRRTLRPGGFVAILDLDHDPEGAFHAHREDFHGHHGFTREGFRGLLEEAGFVDVRFVDAGTVTREAEGGARPFPMFLAVATTPVAAERGQ